MYETKNNLLNKNLTLISFLGLLFLLLFFSLKMISPFLIAITMGGILAMLSYPQYSRLISYGIWPKAAALTVVLGIIILIVSPITLFSGIAIKQGIELSRVMAVTEKIPIQELISNITGWSIFESFNLSPEQTSQKIRDWISSASLVSIKYIFEIINSFPKIILQIVLSTISCFFLLKDGVRFLKWANYIIPLDNQIKKKVAESFENMAFASIWATFAAGFAQALVVFLGFSSLGVPGAFLAAGVTFTASWIPFIGSTPIWLIGSIYLYFHGSLTKTVIMVIIGIFAGVIDNVIRPLVLKGRSKMHPLISILAIFGGLKMFGIVGIFLGPILAVITISLICAWPSVANRYKLVE